VNGVNEGSKELRSFGAERGGYVAESPKIGDFQDDERVALEPRPRPGGGFLNGLQYEFSTSVGDFSNGG
jgi:hypothetical protein